MAQILHAPGIHKTKREGGMNWRPPRMEYLVAAIESLFNDDFPDGLWLALFAVGRRLGSGASCLQCHCRGEDVFLFFDCVRNNLNKSSDCRGGICLAPAA